MKPGDTVCIRNDEFITMYQSPGPVSIDDNGMDSIPEVGTMVPGDVGLVIAVNDIDYGNYLVTECLVLWKQKYGWRETTAFEVQ